MGGSSKGIPDSSPTAGQGGGAGGGAGGSADYCDIRDTGVLRSPAPNVVKHLNLNDLLDVGIEEVEGVSVLISKDASGVILGVIDCRFEQAIIKCISEGHRYRARVDGKQGGAITVGINRISRP